MPGLRQILDYYMYWLRSCYAIGCLSLSYIDSVLCFIPITWFTTGIFPLVYPATSSRGSISLVAAGDGGLINVGITAPAIRSVTILPIPFFKKTTTSPDYPSGSQFFKVCFYRKLIIFWRKKLNFTVQKIRPSMCTAYFAHMDAASLIISHFYFLL